MNRFNHLWQRWSWQIGVGLSFVGYLLFAFWFPLRPYYNRVPLSDVRTFAPSLLHTLGYGGLLLLLFGLMAWLSWQFQQRQTNWPIGTILGITVLLTLPLFYTYPINANDVYRYFIRGRITTVYGESPFAVTAATYREDLYLPLAGEWADATSPYGPLWELTAAGVTAVFPNNLYFSLLTFKLIGLLSLLGITWLLWQLLAPLPPPKRTAYTVLCAWNPALFLMLIVDAHNDGLMLFVLLLGWWLAKRWGQVQVGMLLMVLGALVKPIGILPLPFFFLYFSREMATWRERFTFALVTGVGSITAVWLAFAPFGSPLDLVTRLIDEASRGGSFSPAVWIYFVGVAGGIQPDLGLIGDVLRYSAAVATLWLLWRTWRNGRLPLLAAADIFGLYLWQALNFRIWYSVWLIPWLIAALAIADDEGNQYRLRVGLYFLLTAQLSVLIYGQLRVYLFDGQHMIAHLVGIPFTFGLPWVLARWSTGAIFRQ